MESDDYPFHHPVDEFQKVLGTFPVGPDHQSFDTTVLVKSSLHRTGSGTFPDIMILYLESILAVFFVY